MESGIVHVRSFSVGDRSKLAQFQKSNVELNGEFIARVLIMSVCDESGKRLYTEEDIPALLDLDCGIAEKVVSVALDLNGLTEDAHSEAKKN